MAFTVVPAKEEPSLYESVDLGLPSGTKWATHNIGATNPEDAGLYFSFGEVEPYDPEKDYKWLDNGSYTKYTIKANSTGDIVDNKVTLDSEDDAATINWGDNWRTPSPQDVNELIQYAVSLELEEINSKKCVKLGYSNGNYLVLPLAGMCLFGNVGLYTNTNGYYLTNSIDFSNTSNESLVVAVTKTGNASIVSNSRGKVAFSVRPVCS